MIRELSSRSAYGRPTDPVAKAGMNLPRKFWHRRARSDRLGQDDELPHVVVGDPDPTSDARTAKRSRRCGFEWLDATSKTLVLRWSCTRELGHQGQHIAGTGEEVAAVHPQFSCYRDATGRRILGPSSNISWPVFRGVLQLVTVTPGRLAAGGPSPLPC